MMVRSTVVRLNKLFATDVQQPNAASQRLLRAGQRQH
jgi:hypothetical protein